MKKLAFAFLTVFLWTSLASAADLHFLQALAASKKQQTISACSYSATTPFTVGDADRTITCTAGSGLACSLTTNDAGICTIAAGKVHAVGAGACTVYCDQAGDGHWFAAAQANQGITVSAGTCDGACHDNFTGAEAVLAAPWTETSAGSKDDFYRNGSGLAGKKTAYGASSAYYADSNQDVSQAVLKGSPGDSAQARIMVRVTGSNGYGYYVPFGISGSTWAIDISKNGIGTLCSLSSISNTVDNTVKITASGTTTVTLKFYLGGVEQTPTPNPCQDTSATFTSGHPGLSSWSGTTGYGQFWDNWQDY